MAASQGTMGALLRGLEAVLTTKKRKKLKKPSFGLPGRKAYPMPDKAHAGNAKARAKQMLNKGKLSKSAYDKIVAKANKKIGESTWTIKKVGRFQEVSRFVEAVDPKTDLEGRMIPVVLITVGLGNKRDKNYYGVEAIESGVEVFEGASAFINHPTEEEEQIIPERRVEAKCGYFKNCKKGKFQDMKTGKMVDGLGAELHFDLSEAGECAYQKALTAQHYRAEFPDSPYEYVGLSVNADGDAERRTIEIEGEETEVNYVLSFSRDASTSCDVVTSPARGGRFLTSLVEDEDGALRVVQKEEPVKKNLKKLLASARTAFKAYESEKDEKAKKAKLVEAIKKMKEADDAVEAEPTEEADILGLEAFGKSEGESEAEHKDRLMKMGAALKKEMEAYAEAEGEGEGEDDGDGEDDDGEEAPQKKQQQSDRKPKKDMESARLAVRHLISEAGLDKKSFDPEDVEDLARLPLQEARKQIKREKRRTESLKAALSGSGRMSTYVPKDGVEARESEDDGEESEGSKTFVESFRSRRG